MRSLPHRARPCVHVAPHRTLVRMAHGAGPSADGAVGQGRRCEGGRRALADQAAPAAAGQALGGRRRGDARSPAPAGPAGCTASCTTSTPTRTASWTSARRGSCSSRRCCRPRPPTSGSTSRRRRCSRRWPGPAELAAADRADVEAIIQPTGFFRAKTKSIQGLAAAVLDRYDGEVPGRLEDLVTLPGRRPQDGERGAGQRFRRPGHHRGHPLRPAVAADGLDHRGGPGQGRARGRRAVPEARLDDAVARPDLPRPADLSRPAAGLRRLPGRRAGARRTARARPTRCWPGPC